jgi:hypothetical protein
VGGTWPHHGEVDLFEFYHDDHGKGEPVIKANVACAAHPASDAKRWKAEWDSTTTKLAEFGDEFFDTWHTWRWVWLPSGLIELWLDGKRLLHASPPNEYINPGGDRPFGIGKHQKLRLNLAVGGDNGGNPAGATDAAACFVIREVRLYQGAGDGYSLRTEPA